MKRAVHPIALVILLSTICSAVMGCASEAGPTVDESAVRQYADPATETCLQGLSDHDLAKYTEYANDDFKAAVTQEILDATGTQLDKQLGAYESKEFLRTEEMDGYVIVHYKAEYEKGEAGIRMVFDADHLIAGQWFE
ncbi:MAG: DUF3887 domain-containing protein [Dehalococcoidia bacterium]|nr:DUF3887 domain-containing protein [Dehalococcoidia bacterium]